MNHQGKALGRPEARFPHRHVYEACRAEGKGNRIVWEPWNFENLKEGHSLHKEGGNEPEGQILS